MNANNFKKLIKDKVIPVLQPVSVHDGQCTPSWKIHNKSACLEKRYDQLPDAWNKV